jgi:hypothetical protein
VIFIFAFFAAAPRYCAPPGRESGGSQAGAGREFCATRVSAVISALIQITDQLRAGEIQLNKCKLIPLSGIGHLRLSQISVKVSSHSVQP